MLATKNSKYMLCNILRLALGRGWLVTCLTNFYLIHAFCGTVHDSR